MLSAIVGHRRLVTLLSRAVARDTLPPAMLLAGQSGIGKRRIAMALAAAINCQAPRSTPELERDGCGTCAACRRIARLVYPDVILLEPGDTGTIKIDAVRDVVDRAGYRPFEGRRRVVIIDEADALVAAAQNAMLKTLEEPPSASVFVLVSSLPDALLPTVRSRCPRLRFGPLTAAEVAQVLTRDHGYSAEDAGAASADADGSVGRALSQESTDLIEARDQAHRLLEFTARVNDPARRLESVKELTGRKSTAAEEREQLSACLRSLASQIRDISLMTSGGDPKELANLDLEPRLRALSAAFDRDRSDSAYAAVDRGLASLERNASPKVVADWVVLQI